MDRDVAQQTATPQAPGQAGLFSVPNPYPLTLAGLLAALGPQAINFGISVGGGETMLIPNIASLGGTRLFWLMTISTVLETVVVYECIKYSMVTGRSFFSMTRDIKPYGFWPWFWGISALATFAWPAWLAGASSAMFKLTGVATYYTWCAIALVAVLLVFYFSNVIYRSLSKIFIAVMWINIVAVIIVVALIATKDDYLTVLWGYFNFGIAGYPEGLKLSLAAALLNQPGGSLMWVSFWVLEAGWGMGRYTGRVTGVLRPPEQINTDVLPWDTSNPEEVRKMQGWVSVGKWSLILWWSVIGAMFMTFLYATAGQAYLFRQGIVASGLDVPLQMATIVGGVFGPLVFAVFLVFLFVTLYDAEFAIYDTFIGRTVTDAIASTPRLRGRHPYRVYYFIVVTVAIAAGFYLVTLGQPYALWLLVAFLAIIMRSIAAAQILYVNKRHLPAAFKPSVFNQVVLWFTIVSGFLCASIWGYAYFAGI
jgi:hypothetical protein